MTTEDFNIRWKLEKGLEVWFKERINRTSMYFKIVRLSVKIVKTDLERGREYKRELS